MREQSFSEQLWNGLGDAVADIREKLEESLFGRAVTERGEAPQWPRRGSLAASLRASSVSLSAARTWT